MSGGKAIVTGATASIDFPIDPDPGAIDNVGPAATATDVFVTQLDHDGTGLLWSTYIGGTNPVPASFNDDEIGMGVARAVSGAVCITGFTTDDDFPQVDAIQTTSNFGEAFVATISGGGTTLDFSTFVRAASAESGISARCWGLALDPDEIDPTRVDVWLTGDLKDAGPGDARRSDGPR